MKRIIKLLFFVIVTTLFAKTEPHQIKLVDSLDRAEDGYCLDVAGSGKYIRADLPLIGHNCKAGLYADEAFVFRTDGTIYFPTFDLCATISGVNESVLDYTSLTLKECHKNTPFLNAKFMQSFEYTEDKKIKHKNSNKCLTMGAKSSETFSSKHTWRTLYMKECSSVDSKRASWFFHKP